MATQLKTFVFDMGNVLAFFSHELMYEKLARLCGVSDEHLKTVMAETNLQSNFERGLLTERDFHAWFEQTFQRKIDFADLCVASSDIFSLNSTMMPVLEALKKQGFRLVLLSNTCSTHISRIRSEWDFLDLFDDLILSYEVKSAKPDREIYDITIQRIECPASAALYTDDILEYVECGRRSGMHAVQFTTTEQFIEDLKDFGVRV